MGAGSEKHLIPDQLLEARRMRLCRRLRCRLQVWLDHLLFQLFHQPRMVHGTVTCERVRLQRIR